MTHEDGDGEVSLMARDMEKNSHLDYIARALTRPWTGLPTIRNPSCGAIEVQADAER
jgi:hypothetical protein